MIQHSGTVSSIRLLPTAAPAGADAVSTVLVGLCGDKRNNVLEEFLICLAFAGRHQAGVNLEDLLSMDK